MLDSILQLIGAKVINKYTSVIIYSDTPKLISDT